MNIPQHRIQSLGKVLVARLESEADTTTLMRVLMAGGALACIAIWLMLTAGLTFLLVRNPSRMGINEFYITWAGMTFALWASSYWFRSRNTAPLVGNERPGGAVVDFLTETVLFFPDIALQLGRKALFGEENPARRTALIASVFTLVAADQEIEEQRLFSRTLELNAGEKEGDVREIVRELCQKNLLERRSRLDQRGSQVLELVILGEEGRRIAKRFELVSGSNGHD